LLRGRASKALGLLLVTFILSQASAPRAGQVQPARDACSTGEPQARIAACTQTLGRTGLDPASQVSALVNRAIARDSIGEFDLALGDFDAALTLAPNDWSALRSRAAAYYRRGQLENAVADLTRAVTALPDDVAPLRLRGQLYAEMGQVGRAVEDLSKVLDRYPGDLGARQARGLTLAAAGDHARATLDFNRILERDPRLRVARAARAFSLFRTRQYRLAIQDWDQLLKDDPSQPQILYCRGVAKMLIGDDTGRVDVETVRQQKPDVARAEAAACPAP
jgi:tetratricopeptide (TPR) repeat protein